MAAVMQQENEFRPNPGFKKGYDPRRWSEGTKILPDGRTLAMLAREHAPEAIATVAAVMNGKDPQTGEDKDWPVQHRLRAAELILERGFGKATQHVELNAAGNIDLEQLSRDALLRIVASAESAGESEAEIIESPEGEKEG